ncbi:MAG: hypothetical protein K6G15_11525 [Desulfovibrio sp.]|nr:hypothetical protein [Desulfovibrio sp.]
MIWKKTLFFLVLITSFCLFAQSLKAQELNAISIQGTWSGRDGQNQMVLVLQGERCAMQLNGQSISGIWTLVGNQLIMNFANGRNVRYTVAYNGQVLTLDGSVQLTRASSQPTPPQAFPPQAPQASGLDGLWSVQTAQGLRSFRFQGNRYAQLINGQVVEEGQFALFADGRFRYQVTAGQYAGQSGENRLMLQGQSFTMFWPNGMSLTYQRQVSGNASPMGQTPLDGRWVWAKNGPVSFGFIFSGNRFVALWNNAEQSRGTFQIQGSQLVMHHESGPEAGKTDVLLFQLNGNRLLIFTTTDPNVDPIPYVRQGM